MENKNPYPYKAINNPSIIKNFWKKSLNLGLKKQNNDKKLAVQKANPSKQGLKQKFAVIPFLLLLVQKANPSKQGLKQSRRVFRGPCVHYVQKANPSKQGLKLSGRELWVDELDRQSKKLIHQNKD